MHAKIIYIHNYYNKNERNLRVTIYHCACARAGVCVCVLFVITVYVKWYSVTRIAFHRQQGWVSHTARKRGKSGTEQTLGISASQCKLLHVSFYKPTPYYVTPQYKPLLKLLNNINFTLIQRSNRRFCYLIKPFEIMHRNTYSSYTKIKIDTR